MSKSSHYSEFVEKDSHSIRIQINGKIESYEYIKIIEFSSDRKKMSVVVRRVEDNKIFVFVKGADSVMMNASNKDDDINGVVNCVNDMADLGLRTLMFGMKELDSKVTLETMPDTSIIENNLTILGATGLEDVLQDNVAQCIMDFKNASIKVWMLTGDKAETAQNIGISCGLIDP